MKKKKVIGIIGQQAGGKGAVSDLIIKKFGGSRLTTSNILRRTLDSLHIPSSRDTLTNLALSLKEGFGKDVLMKAMLKDVALENSDLTIVDGIRMPGDVDPFKEEYGEDFTLLYVTADAKVRYERSVNRGEKAGESEQSFEEFASKELTETEKYIEEVGKQADYVITNNGDIEELEKQVEDILSKI